MSGIVGLWNLDGEPVAAPQLRELSARLAHRGPDGEGVWLDGPVGLVCQLMRVTPESQREVQPLVHPHGVVIFDGRLDNREELLGRLAGAHGLCATSPDPDFILAAYLAWGENFPEKLKGDFALAVFDPVRQKLVLARDAIGIRPLYYCRQGDLFIFASEIKAILAHPRISAVPDAHMLAHHFLDPRGSHAELTFFKDILTLPPSHQAVITPGRLTIKQYWDFDPSRQIRLSSYQEYVEGFQDFFAQAVRRRLRSAYPVAVAVSGGLDSSSIFCLSLALQAREPGFSSPVFGVSFVGPPGSAADEEEYLKAIETKYDVQIARGPVSSQGFFKSCQTQVWHTEVPLPDVEWNSWLNLLAAARNQEARVLLLGFYGDQILFEQAYLLDLAKRGHWREVFRHLKEIPLWYTDAAPGYYKQRFVADLLKSILPESLTRVIKKFRNRRRTSPRARIWSSEKLCREIARPSPGPNGNKRRFATNYAKYVYQRLRSRYDVLGMEWNDKVSSLCGLEVSCPFCDRDLIAFMMTVPGEMQNRGGVPRALLRHALAGVLPEEIAGRRSKGDYTYLENEAVTLDYDDIVNYIRSGNFAVRWGFLKQDAFNKEIPILKEKMSGPTCDVAWSLEEVVGMEIWLRTFFDKPPV
jgi:asparagine synthase (glutamine-hydrolysing)